MTARKKYSKEFKLDAIALVVEQQQSRVTTYAEMSFKERLGLLAKHEILCWQNTKIKRLVTQGKMRLDVHASYID